MIDKNKSVIYTYNVIADEYERVFGEDYRDSIYIDKFLDSLNGKNILDIGSGVGNLTNYIYEREFNVRGIDLSDGMLNIATSKYPHITFDKMDMRNITYNEKFDGLMLTYSLLHLTKDDIKTALERFHNILNDNGKMLLILQEGEGEMFIDEPLKEGLKTFYSFFNINEIRSVLEEKNYNVLYSEIRYAYDEELHNNKIILLVDKNS